MDKVNFQTPDWVCDLMLAQIKQPQSILEPSPGAGNLVRKIQDKFSGTRILVPENDFFKLNVEKVDWIVANPPFTPMKLGYQMLDRMFLFSNKIVCLMPWLTLINSEKRTKMLVDRGLRKIIHLPRKAFPGSRVQTCIMVIEGNTAFNNQIIWESA